MRGRGSEGGSQEVIRERWSEEVREGDKMGRSWVERDWDRQRKEVRG